MRSRLQENDVSAAETVPSGRSNPRFRIMQWFWLVGFVAIWVTVDIYLSEATQSVVLLVPSMAAVGLIKRVIKGQLWWCTVSLIFGMTALLCAPYVSGG